MERKSPETPIEMSRRHVLRCQDIIARQTEIVEKFRARGWPAQLACEMLSEYQRTLHDERTHLALLVEEKRWAIGAMVEY